MARRSVAGKNQTILVLNSGSSIAQVRILCAEFGRWGSNPWGCCGWDRPRIWFNKDSRCWRNCRARARAVPRISAASARDYRQCFAYSRFFAPGRLCIFLKHCWSYDMPNRHSPLFGISRASIQPFHKTMPKTARHFAVPAQYFEQGVMRYGFHGLSCESIVHQLHSNHQWQERLWGRRRVDLLLLVDLFRLRLHVAVTFREEFLSELLVRRDADTIAPSLIALRPGRLAIMDAAPLTSRW